MIEALAALKRRCSVDIHRQPVRLPGHEQLDPRLEEAWLGPTADKKPVKNVELWQRLDAGRAAHRALALGQGHAGDEGNERADALANRGVDEVLAGG